MQTDAFTEALLREKRQATNGASSSSDTGPGLQEGVCMSYQDAHMMCPYCPKEPLDFQGLVQHLEDAHGSYPQRAAKCPICRRTARDMVPHLMQHVGSFEEDELGCNPSHHEASGRLINPSSSQGPFRDVQITGRQDGPSSSGEEAPPASGDRAFDQHAEAPPSATPEPDKSELGQLEASPSGAPAEASKAADLPPPQPGGLQDTLETRAAFVQQMMLDVFGLGR